MRALRDAANDLLVALFSFFSFSCRVCFLTGSQKSLQLDGPAAATPWLHPGYERWRREQNADEEKAIFIWESIEVRVGKRVPLYFIVSSQLTRNTHAESAHQVSSAAQRVRCEDCLWFFALCGNYFHRRAVYMGFERIWSARAQHSCRPALSGSGSRGVGVAFTRP